METADKAPDEATANGEAKQELPDLPEATDDGVAPDVDTEVAPVVGGGKKKKNKKKKKKKENLNDELAGMRRLAKNRGTGLEDNFAESPMTEQEAQDEQALYDPERAFHERIETAIQRYLARRRFSPKQKAMFDVYLFMGGINSSARQFSGAADMDTSDMTKQEVRDASSSVAISRGGGDPKYYSPGDDDWEVDFVGVLKGYCGESLIAHTGLNLADMRVGIHLVENFLRYLLHHDVCPEYADQVREAVEFCGSAWLDLVETWGALMCVPGDFNFACANMFRNGLIDPPPMRQSDLDPKLVFSALFKEEEEKRGPTKNHVVREDDRTLQVIAVHPVTEDIRSVVDTFNEKHKEKPYPAFGSVSLKEVYVRDGWWTAGNPYLDLDPQPTVLYFEEDALDKFKPGMILRMRIAKLKSGLKFISKPYCVMPHWYTFLPQTLMRDYREPGPLPSKEDDTTVNDAKGDGGGDGGDGDGGDVDSSDETWVGGDCS